MSIRALRACGAWSVGLMLALAACTVKDPDDDPVDPSAGSGGSAGKNGDQAGEGPGPGGGGDDGGEAGSSGTNGGVGGDVAGQGGDSGSGGSAGTSGSSGSSGTSGSGGTGGIGGGKCGDAVATPVAGSGRGVTGPLVLQVSSAQSPAVVGQSLAYTITVGNTSTVAIKDVEVLFRVPKGLQMYYSYALPASSGCGNGTCSENEEATWTFDIPAGGLKSIQFEPSVLDVLGDGDTIAPQIRLNAPDLDTLTVTPSVPVVSSVPVELSVGADADPVVAGEEVELSVDLGHLGESGLFDGELRLELPGWLQATSASDGGVVAEGETNTVSWDIAEVAVGASFRRLVKATVCGDVAPGEVLNPRASFTYEDAVVDNVAQVDLGVLGKPSPLRLAIQVAADPVVPGAMVSYFATVTNTSQRAVDGVTLYRRIPADESFYYTYVEPNSSGCGNGTCSDGELASWELGTLASGASQTVEIPASVLAQVAGDGSLITAPFQLDGIGVSSLRRQKTVAVHAKPAAQLVLGTAVSPAVPGQAFVYDVDVGQIGPGSLQGSVVTLELPPGVSAAAPSDGGTLADGKVVWDLGAIAVAQTRHRTVSITVDDATAVGSILGARATLQFSGGQERDLVSELAVPIVGELPPLAVTLAATPSPIVLGNVVASTTTIKNTAERTLDGVTLQLRMPAGHSFYYTTGADPDSSGCGNGTCSENEEAVWELGSMTAGSTKMVSVNPTVATTLTAGSLVTLRQRLTAVDLGATILLQSTLPTKK